MLNMRLVKVEFNGGACYTQYAEPEDWDELQEHPQTEVEVFLDEHATMDFDGMDGIVQKPMSQESCLKAAKTKHLENLRTTVRNKANVALSAKLRATDPEVLKANAKSLGVPLAQYKKMLGIK